MDGVRIEKQPDGNWKLHVPGQPDIILTPQELSDLIHRLDFLMP